MPPRALTMNLDFEFKTMNFWVFICLKYVKNDKAAKSETLLKKYKSILYFNN